MTPIEIETLVRHCTLGSAPALAALLAEDFLLDVRNTVPLDAVRVLGVVAGVKQSAAFFAGTAEFTG